MEITEVRIKLMEESEDRLRAFCSITIDGCFVVRDLKIIEGSSGPFVAMPSRKLTERCPKCGYKNHLRSNYCNQCGAKIRGSTASRDLEANANKLYADIAHPINQGCRDIIQNAVVAEYQAELERAKLPGYQSRYDDEYAEGARHLSPEAAEELLDATDHRSERGVDVAPAGELRVDAGPADDAPRQPKMNRPRESRTDANSDFGKGILDGSEE